MPTESTLYRDLIDAGCDTDHHESDLYVVVTPESTAILTRYKGQQDLPTTFVSNTDGRRNYEIPFGYEPFWAAKQAKIDHTRQREGLNQ